MLVKFHSHTHGLCALLVSKEASLPNADSTASSIKPQHNSDKNQTQRSIIWAFSNIRGAFLGGPYWCAPDLGKLPFIDFCIDFLLHLWAQVELAACDTLQNVSGVGGGVAANRPRSTNGHRLRHIGGRLSDNFPDVVAEEEAKDYVI